MSTTTVMNYSSVQQPTLKDLTENDAKIIGKATALRRSRTTSPSKFKTSAMMTIHSTWTPNFKRPSNSKIFDERMSLVNHWFDLWTDAQRKVFLEGLLEKSEHSQHLHVRQWFDSRVPLQRVDFTQVLPRFLSTKIFSLLDPRSLSRSGTVSWNWKSITEQDVLWIPKCKKFGWYLPYSPNSLEVGAWKRHYVSCTLNLDVSSPRKSLSETYGRLSDGSETERRLRSKSKEKHLSATKISVEQSKAILESRPVWVRPDAYPHDLDAAQKALFSGYDPNEPLEPGSARLLHNEFGQVDPAKSAMLATTSGYGLELEGRKSQHRLPKSSGTLPSLERNENLTTCMDIERFTESQYTHLIDMPWEPPKKRIVDQGPNMSGGACNYPMPWKRVVPDNIEKLTGLIANYPGHAHPRVIFISSRVPASEMLMDAVMLGVIPIVYEFEGTTLETLLFRLDNVLQGRCAQSIGLFCHQKAENEIRLVHGNTLNLNDLDHPDIHNFVITLSGHVLPGEQAGHVDIFLPFGAYREGTEILLQLNILTGIQWISPTSILGQYASIDSEWTALPEGVHPPSGYFEKNKLAVWNRTAVQVEAAVKKTKDVLAGFFDDLKVDLHRQITGQIMFDALGQTDIVGIRKIGEHILEGLLDLDTKTNTDPLEHLGIFLLRAAGKWEIDPEPLASDAEDEDFDADSSLLRSTNRSLLRSWKLETTKRGKDVENLELQNLSCNSLAFSTRRMKLTGTIGSRGPMHVTPDLMSDHPEKRTPIAQELLASEVSYLRCLEAVRDCFYVPLRRSLDSNKAVLSAQHLQTIFADMQVLLEVSRALTADIRARLKDWSSIQCLGDVYLKFTGKLKVYSNYFLNYSTIVSNIERSVETNPNFRAFLARRECQPETQMLSLHELFLLPTQRIQEYVTLLTWFLDHTPLDHPDCIDIIEAIRILTTLKDKIETEKLRIKHDRELVKVQKLIQNCPLLLEANRYFILQENMALLLPPTRDDIDAEYRIYQHVEDSGIFLFSDSFVITRRVSKNLPYEREKQDVFTFQSSVALHRLSLYDVADSKFAVNVVQVQTSKRRWFFSCNSCDAKQKFVTTLERAIRGALDNQD